MLYNNITTFAVQTKTDRIMSLYQQKKWQTLLNPEQQEKYANAIRQGYFDTYDGAAWRHTFYGAWLWKHPNRVRAVARFEELVGHLPQWDDVTEDNLRDYHAELVDHYAPNSVKVISAELCAIIREHGDKKIPLDMMNLTRIMRSKKVPSVAVYLTDYEVRRIDMYNPKTVRRRAVKRIFMIECLAGARFCDCWRINTNNIVEKDGVRFLRYVAQKSNTEVMVPLHKMLVPYLVKSPLEPNNIDLATFNLELREMCKYCGIVAPVKVFHAGKELTGRKYNFVSSHTGRRSFATNLSRKGASLEQIAIMMGHMTGNVPNTDMTRRYICEKMELDAKVFKLFQ